MSRRKRISPKTICGMIFGHIHNNTNAAYWPLIRASPQMLNAGVDVNDFQPVTLEELMENNDRFKVTRHANSEATSHASSIAADDEATSHTAHDVTPAGRALKNNNLSEV